MDPGGVATGVRWLLGFALWDCGAVVRQSAYARTENAVDLKTGSALTVHTVPDDG